MTTADKQRILWRVNLVTQPVDPQFAYRHPSQQDCGLLGSLMFEAYRGTIDERHGTMAEAISHVGKYLDGEFGSPLLDCSYVALQDSRPISVTLVALDGGEPLLAQVYTAPDWQNKGLATALIQMSMNTLAESGVRVLNLMATAGNAPAEHLYRNLGFKPVHQGSP